MSLKRYGGKGDGVQPKHCVTKGKMRISKIVIGTRLFSNIGLVLVCIAIAVLGPYVLYLLLIWEGAVRSNRKK